MSAAGSRHRKVPTACSVYFAGQWLCTHESCRGAPWMVVSSYISSQSLCSANSGSVPHMAQLESKPKSCVGTHAHARAHRETHTLTHSLFLSCRQMLFLPLLSGVFSLLSQLIFLVPQSKDKREKREENNGASSFPSSSGQKMRKMGLWECQLLEPLLPSSRTGGDSRQCCKITQGKMLEPSPVLVASLSAQLLHSPAFMHFSESAGNCFLYVVLRFCNQQGSLQWVYFILAKNRGP